MRLARLLLTLLIGGVIGIPAVGLAQESESRPASSVEIVDLNLSRYDEGGQVTMVVEFRNIEELDESALVVTENGTAVANVEISTIEEIPVPVGVVLVIDISGSMLDGPIEAAKEAARSFVVQIRDQDSLALVAFGDEVQVLSSFTSNRSRLAQEISGLEAAGETAFFDAVVAAAELYSRAARLQPNIIVLTDGGDTVSTATLEDALAAVAEAEARVFGVALESPEFNPADLQAIADASEGLFLSTPDPGQLSGLYDAIRRELDNKLILTFTASETLNTDVEFGVLYQGLEASETASVPGYIVRATLGQQTATTTVTYEAPEPFVITSSAPVSLRALTAISIIAVALSVVLFLVILVGGKDDGTGSALQRRLQAYGRRPRSEAVEKGSLLSRIPLLRKFTESAEEAAARRGLLSGIRNALEQGNIPLRPGEAIFVGLGLSVLAGFIGGIATRSLLIGVIVLGVSLLLVAAVVRFVAGREKSKFEDQLPDTLTLLSTSLRAGYSLLQAVEAVAAEAPDPTAREFGRVIAESRLGRQVPDALSGITQRMQSKDFDWTVMAIEIQREVGGNLAEVLQTVADTMRTRNRMRREIKALTAEGRISAIVLGAMPFFLAFFLWGTNRSYLEPLFETTMGQIMIGIGALLMAAGAFWLRKIVDIEI